MENKTIKFLDADGLGIPNVTIISDVNGSQTSGSDGIVTFPDGKQVFTTDETSGPPTEIASVVANFMFKSIS